MLIKLTGFNSGKIYPIDTEHIVGFSKAQHRPDATEVTTTQHKTNLLIKESPDEILTLMGKNSGNFQRSEAR